MSEISSPWILLVEDDPIFSMLFCRFWRAGSSGVEIRLAKSLAQVGQILETSTSAPQLCIFDKNLPDGDGHVCAESLGLPTHCWSALGDAGGEAKPEGRAALERVVEVLSGRMGHRRDAYPLSEGSTRLSQE